MRKTRCSTPSRSNTSAAQTGLGRWTTTKVSDLHSGGTREEGNSTESRSVTHTSVGWGKGVRRGASHLCSHLSGGRGEADWWGWGGGGVEGGVVVASVSPLSNVCGRKGFIYVNVITYCDKEKGVWPMTRSKEGESPVPR